MSEEAQQKKCAYVVYTTLTELRNADDPYQHVPGTIETNPNSQWSHQNGRAEAQDPEFRVTVDYKLVRSPVIMWLPALLILRNSP